MKVKKIDSTSKMGLGIYKRDGRDEKDERQNDKDNKKRKFEDHFEKSMDKYKRDKKEIDLTTLQRIMGTNNVNIREYHEEEEER